MMERDKAKTIFVIHTNGEDEWIKVPKKTYEMIIDRIYDEHEAKLTKACEILEGAILVGIERNLAECKAKDERIAELEAKLTGLKPNNIKG